MVLQTSFKVHISAKEKIYQTQILCHKDKKKIEISSTRGQNTVLVDS